MFIAVRKYQVKRGAAAEWANRVRTGFVPLVRELEGFRGYYLVDGGQDVLIAISMFDNADAALASNEKAAAWVRNHVLEFVRGTPEVMVGDVLVAEPSNAPDGAA
ncbi:MAG TPA: antibiotic biosynthesis monooxygenase [Acetobacteraceae bacterium]|jgi:heme-degrading monooxygenase HmoA|nr:antibiotic biosynthesis monooxygenase [Acetobacteraceae bacterium]